MAGSDRPDVRSSPTLGSIAFTCEREGRSRRCTGVGLNLFSIRYKLQCYNYRAANVIFVVSVMGSIRDERRFAMRDFATKMEAVGRSW